MAEGTARAEGLGVTIKTGKGYDDTWLTFTGSPQQVRALIVDTFALDDTDLTVFELVQNATTLAHGVNNVVAATKGKVVPNNTPAAPKPDEAQQQTSEDPWSEATEPEKDPYQVLDEAITACLDVAALRQLYADNTAMFTADTLAAKAAKKAWSAKGKALSAA